MINQFNTIRHATKVKIEFISVVDGKRYIFENYSQEFGQKNIPGSAVISINTSKTMGDAAGRFSIRVVDKPIYVKTKDYYDKKLYEESPRDAAFFIDVHEDVNAKQISWFDFIQHFTIVKITINDKRIMNCLVTDINRTTSLSAGGIPNVFIDISGVDFGGLFVMHKVFYELLVPELSVEILGLDPLIKMMFLTKGLNYRDSRIGRIIGNVWDDVFMRPFEALDGIGFKWADGSKMSDKIDLIISDNLNYDFSMQFNIKDYVGEFWNLFKAVIQQPFNEVFTDVGGKPRILSAYLSIGDDSDDAIEATNDEDAVNKGIDNNDEDKTYVIIRPTPFDVPIWEEFVNENLESFEPPKLIKYKHRHRMDKVQEFNNNIINEVDVISRDLGKSLNEVVNYFFAYPTQLAIPEGLMKSFRDVLFDIRSIRKYGLRQKYIRFNSIDFMPQDLLDKYSAEDSPQKKATQEKVKDFMTTVIQDSLHRLVSWYRFNDKYKSGSITIYEKDIRIGEYVYFNSNKDDERNWYYVETVQHNYSYPSMCTTTLGVTRGRPDMNPGYSLRK